MEHAGTNTRRKQLVLPLESFGLRGTLVLTGLTQ